MALRFKMDFDDHLLDFNLKHENSGGKTRSTTNGGVYPKTQGSTAETQDT
jgi:hypothetical protein